MFRQTQFQKFILRLVKRISFNTVGMKLRTRNFQQHIIQKKQREGEQVMDNKKEVINGNITELNAQQLDGVSGGVIGGAGPGCSHEKLGTPI